jgi:hypothetical protein
MILLPLLEICYGTIFGTANREDEHRILAVSPGELAEVQARAAPPNVAGLQVSDSDLITLITFPPLSKLSTSDTMPGVVVFTG